MISSVAHDPSDFVLKLHLLSLLFMLKTV